MTFAGASGCTENRKAISVLVKFETFLSQERLVVFTRQHETFVTAATSTVQACSAYGTYHFVCEVTNQLSKVNSGRVAYSMTMGILNNLAHCCVIIITMHGAIITAVVQTASTTCLPNIFLVKIALLV